MHICNWLPLNLGGRPAKQEKQLWEDVSSSRPLYLTQPFFPMLIAPLVSKDNSQQLWGCGGERYAGRHTLPFRAGGWDRQKANFFLSGAAEHATQCHWNRMEWWELAPVRGTGNFLFSRSSSQTSVQKVLWGWKKKSWGPGMGGLYLTEVTWLGGRLVWGLGGEWWAKVGVQLIGCGLDRRRQVPGTRIWCELSSGMMWVWETMPYCGRRFRN